MLSTCNAKLGLFTMMAIGSVIFWMGVACTFFGENFGIIEATTFMLVIGLSSHQCVHITMMYSNSIYSDRESKAKYALDHMFRTSIGSAIALVLSTLVMLSRETKPLNNFGYLVVVCSIMSLLVSTVFLTSFLSALGPEGDEGKLNCKKCCKSKKS